MKMKSGLPKQSPLPLAQRDFSRRNFLRGMGLAMALPALESIFPKITSVASGANEAARLAATTATGAPLRTAFLYFPNGAIPAAWWPTGGVNDFVLSRTLKPLENVRKHIQILGGLNDLSANGGADGGGEHARANGTFLTGVRIKKTNGADFHAGISIDQVMAQQIGLLTPFRSLEITCDVVLNTGSCDTDYACVYQHNLAWSGPTTPMTPEVDPRLLFERLFGAGTPQERAKNLTMRQAQKKSILDFLQSERAGVSKNASSRDRDKLEEYFSSVRDVEQRIQAAEKSRTNNITSSMDVPDGIPKSDKDPSGKRPDYNQYVRLMYDMLLLAFQTDSTRIATFMIGGDGHNRDHMEIGISDGHHNLTHHGGRADYIEKVAQIDYWYVQQLAYFLEKMEATKDIDGNSLLHNSQIVYGSGCADGNRHSHTNLPIILAGAGGGVLKPGRYVNQENVPLTNLFLNMADNVGGKIQERFGDSTGRLKNI